MKSSFKGVSFFLESVNLGFENQINTYEIPGKEKVITENIGQTLAVYPVQAYSIGEDRELIRDQLVAACRSSKPGVLYIPSLGMLRVYCKKISVRDCYDEHRLIRFSMEFVEATDDETAFPEVDKVVSFLQQAKAAKEKYVGELMEALALIDMPGQILNSVLDSLSQIQSLPGAMTASRKEDILDLVGKVEHFVKSFDEMIANQSNEESLNIKPSLKFMPIEIQNFINISILEKIARSVPSGEKLTKRQMQKVIKIADSLLVTTTNKLAIIRILDLIDDYPFLETVPFTPITPIPSLVAIYRGGGDLQKEQTFLAHNQIDNPLAISSPVEVFNG